jgi:tetratricopeptide (TPR) repeat protein
MNLRQFLIERVDVNDLRAISYELGINFDRLRAESKETTVDNFLTKVNQYGRSEDLKASLIKRYQRDDRRRPQPAPSQPEPSADSPPPPAKQKTLLQFLKQHFNLDDLQELAFELNVDFENLAGSTKRAKARALVAHMVRLKRLPALVKAMKLARPFMEPDQLIMPTDNLAERVLWEDRRVIALSATILIMIAAIAGYFIWTSLTSGETWATNEPMPEEVFGIAVAEFAVGGDLHSGPQGQETSRQIYTELEKALESQPSLRDKVALTRVGLARNDVEATQAGNAVNADIVLWGWVPEFTEAALVHNFTFIGDEYVVHNDLILESVNLMISGPSRIQMTQLSGRTKALSRFILALIYVRGGENDADYQQGLNLFIEGIQELENDRTRLTELIDKATSLDERLGLEETLAALEKSLAVFHTGKGVALAALGQPDEALASYQTALTLDDSYPRVHAVLGNYYYSLRQFDEAEASYRKALALDPETAGAWYGLGVIFYYGEDYAQALAHLEQAIAILEAADEDASQAHFAKGYAHLRLVEMVEARQSFETVLQSEEVTDDLKAAVVEQIELIDNPPPVANATAQPIGTPQPTPEFIPTATGDTAVAAPTAEATVQSILGATAIPSATLFSTPVAGETPSLTPPPPTLFPTFAAPTPTLTLFPTPRESPTLFPTIVATSPPATATPTLFPTSDASPTAEIDPTQTPTMPPATPTPAG